MSKKTKGKEYFTMVGYLNHWEEVTIENNIDTNYDKGGMNHHENGWQEKWWV